MPKAMPKSNAVEVKALKLSSKSLSKVYVVNGSVDCLHAFMLSP